MSSSAGPWVVGYLTPGSRRVGSRWEKEPQRRRTRGASDTAAQAT